MTVTLTETPESRAQSYSATGDASLTLLYKASGEQDDATVRNYVAASTPATVNALSGTLYRKTIRLAAEGFQLYAVEVEYAPPDRTTLTSGSYTFSFDTTGGTVHITQAKTHLSSRNHAGDIANAAHAGSIGVKQDGTVEGCDIIIPKLKLTFVFKFPAGRITADYVKGLASITGMTNRFPFLGYNAGELLFLGAVGSAGSETETEVTYEFEASQNLTGAKVGVSPYDITFNKAGHNYVWENYADAVVNGKGRTVIDEVHVEQVYDDADFAAAFNWGIFTG